MRKRRVGRPAGPNARNRVSRVGIWEWRRGRDEAIAPCRCVVCAWELAPKKIRNMRCAERSAATYSGSGAARRGRRGGRGGGRFHLLSSGRIGSHGWGGIRILRGLICDDGFQLIVSSALLARAPIAPVGCGGADGALCLCDGSGLDLLAGGGHRRGIVVVEEVGCFRGGHSSWRSYTTRTTVVGEVRAFSVAERCVCLYLCIDGITRSSSRNGVV